MRRRTVDIFDERRIAAISADVAAAIDAATYGNGAWDDVSATLSGAFPGSFGGLHNTDFPESRLNFLSLQNMDPAFIRAYAEHFAYINPWAAYWMSVGSNSVVASEQVFPARNISHTEFYNDWLGPQKVEAAVGMKLLGDRGEAVYVLLHYPMARSSGYEAAAMQVMKNVSGNLERSINLARLIRQETEGAVTAAALLERSRGAAFILEGDRRVREANPLAMRLLGSGRPMSVRSDRCHIVGDSEADGRFGVELAKLVDGIPTKESRITFREGEEVWQLSLAALPPSVWKSSALSLLPPRRMVLAILTGSHLVSANGHEHSDFAAAFGLTPAEASFCSRLLLGESVSEIADRQGIALETARSRMKAILRKTGAARQSQLMLLLSRMQ